MPTRSIERDTYAKKVNNPNDKRQAAISAAQRITDPEPGAGRFRAASLRNIAVTAPYMHDGRFATLRDVIDRYDHGIGFSDELDWRFKNDEETAVLEQNLSEGDKEALEAFLHALPDEAFLSDPKFSDPFP